MSDKNYYLMVSFDICQQSEKLNWTFLDSEHQPLEKSKGVETGLFVFNTGERMRLNVVANSYLEELVGVHIIDCHLITRPILYSKRAAPELAGEYPYPSPFFDPAELINGQGATASFGHGAAQGGRMKMTWDSDVELIYRNKGNWQMSFIMTVAIERANGLAYRVFSFDPEANVGDGTKLNDPEHKGP
ncbi:hypothetical protein [Massilia phyllosphaerae]|uniref:hypothetical protein n=1 Tax=Massilia phyllosphaerae TaxID=3106034 RepID=UPI002B1CAC22|nr:hypothetical protein [Massilia sp. SGZ-792]